MSKRYWVVLASLGLIVFCTALWYSWDRFSAYQQDQADERAAAAEYQADTAQHSPASCRPVMGESGFFDWLTCLANNVSADGGVKQAEYDLKAQQDMSAWALGMLIATIWLTGITLLGVFFVWRTLQATQDMANKADETNRAAIASLYHQWRPQLFVRRISVKRPPGGGALVGTFQVNNVGGYVGVIKHQYAHFEICDAELPAIPRHSTGAMGRREDWQCNFSVGENLWAEPKFDGMALKDFPVRHPPSSDEIAAIKAEKKRLYIVGYIDYEYSLGEGGESFGARSHRTAFGRQVLWNGRHWWLKKTENPDYDYQT